jgi:hypothetical protein
MVATEWKKCMHITSIISAWRERNLESVTELQAFGNEICFAANKKCGKDAIIREVDMCCCY